MCEHLHQGGKTWFYNIFQNNSQKCTYAKYVRKSCCVPAFTLSWKITLNLRILMQNGCCKFWWNVKPAHQKVELQTSSTTSRAALRWPHLQHTTMTSLEQGSSFLSASDRATIEPGDEWWVPGMESRLASPPWRCATRLAELLGERRQTRRPSKDLWHFRGERTASLCCLGCFAWRPCRNESCLLLSALRPHAHSHLVQPQHRGSCALPLVVTSEAARPEMLCLMHYCLISLLAPGLLRRFLSAQKTWFNIIASYAPVLRM